MKDTAFFLNEANILIIGDYNSNTEILINILSFNGYNVRSVLNYKLQMEIIKENLPDIILMYVDTDGINGIEFYKTLKKDKEFNEIPAILIYSKDENINKEEVFISGGKDYLSIPFNNKEVLSKVETHLKLKFMEDEIQNIKNSFKDFNLNIFCELRIPIKVILSAIHMSELKLHDCSFQDSNFYKYMKIMKQNCYCLLRQINNFMDTTKIDSGYSDISKSNIDIINKNL